MPNYTFTELFDLAPNFDPATERLIATATVSIVQEDGRCAYGSGTVYVDPLDRVVDAQSNDRAVDSIRGFKLCFSDRQRFIGQNDEIGLHMVDAGGTAFDLTIVLWEWGGHKYDVRLELSQSPPGTKLYTGWGETIGRGSGQALHTISFSDLAVLKVLIN
jgi:hypothetical protein